MRSIWADPLHDGPVPGGLTDAELLEIRRQYLAEPRSDGGEDPSQDPANDLRQWRAVLRRRESYDELVLWFEHDLFDQLNLIQLLSWIRDHLAPLPPVSLISIGSFPGHPEFKGLGELTPSELASLFGLRAPIEEEHYRLGQRLWRAFRELSPQELDDVRRADTAALPYVSQAITRFLEEYPWTTDGLSRTERRLLELADGGPQSLLRLFPHMHEGERVYYVTDTSLAALAAALSRTSPPLLRLDAGSGSGPAIQGAVSLTDAGRSVLEGRLDRIAACGIDRWLGGVHLQGRSSTWRWDPDRQRVVR